MPGHAGAGLLERGAEELALGAALDAAAAGRGGLVVLSGAAGIGKTELLVGCRVAATARGFAVATARGGPLETEYPFGVVRQLFEPLLVAAGEDERAALLDGVAAPARLAVGELPAGAAAGERELGLPVLHGLFWLAAHLAARGPLLLAIDDAHWCDAASMRWLDYLARRVEDQPMLVALTVRDGEPLTAALDALALDAGAGVLRPGPLSTDAAALLLAGVLGVAPSPAFAGACHEASGGNPFLLLELARTLAADGIDPGDAAVAAVPDLAPQGVTRSVAIRLARLGGEAQAVARAVAVLGRESELGHVAAFCGLAPEAASRCVTALVDAHVLADRRPLEFEHPLVRAAVERDRTPAVLAADHARAARLLARAGLPPERVAPQLLAAEPVGDPWTVDVLSQAAASAAARGAAEAARALAARALAEPPTADRRVGVLLVLGQAEARTGDNAAAERHLGEAAELARDPQDRATAALGLARSLFTRGRLKDVIGVLSAAAADARAAARPDCAAPLEAELIGASFLLPDTHLEAVERLARSPEEADERTRRLLAAQRAWSAMLAGRDAPGAARWAARALDEGLVESEGAEAAAVYLAIGALIVAERWDAADAHLRTALADARRHGSVAGFVIASTYRSTVHARLGRLAEAEADATAAVDAALEHGLLGGVPSAVAYLVDVLVDRGRLDEAEDRLRRTRFDGDLPRGFLFAFVLAARGRLRLARGDLRAGPADLLECGRRQRRSGRAGPAVEPWRSRAAYGLQLLGDHQAATALVDEELALGRRWGTPRGLGIALHAAGLRAGGADGVALLAEAVDVLGASPAALEHARALTDLGVALAGAGDREAGLARLREGLDLAHRAGADALVRRAREGLVSAGARPRRHRISGVEALTASERRTARLAADGLTNRAIAESQFVTVKTVESHLRAAFRKLDVSARGDLAAVLADERG